MDTTKSSKFTLFFILNPLALTTVVSVLVAIIAFFWPNFSGVSFQIKPNTLAGENLVNILAPAFIAALFIERAVETLVVALRKNKRETLEIEVKDSERELAELIATDSNSNTTEQQKLTENIEILKSAITHYKRSSTAISSSLCIVFSLVIATIGVRLLAPFFDIEYLDCLSGANIIPEDCPSGMDNLQSHYDWFIRLDVFISTFIIAGGAAGMHSIVGAITSFADKAKQINSQA